MSIYILCPYAIRTGGPEALHQLSDALLDQGFDARIAYYTQAQADLIARWQSSSAYRFGDAANDIEEYARYATKPVDVVPNEPGAIVVLPEPLCHLAPKFDKARVLVWWLSVDNGFGALSRVNLNHLRAPNVRHAAQSKYANRLIAALKLPPAAGEFLSDYTADLREYAEPLAWQDRPMMVVFNSNHKVTADVAAMCVALKAHDREIDTQIVGGLPRREMAALFAKARVFVDLGSMPGKDRMPREAMLMGCGVITDAHNGAGDELFGVKIEDDEDCVPNIRAILLRAQPPEIRTRARADLMIDLERAAFRREVETVFVGFLEARNHDASHSTAGSFAEANAAFLPS